MTKLEKLMKVMERAENVCGQFQYDKNNKVDWTLVVMGTDIWGALEDLQAAVKDLEK